MCYQDSEFIMFEAAKGADSPTLAQGFQQLDLGEFKRFFKPWFPTFLGWDPILTSHISRGPRDIFSLKLVVL